MEMFMFLTFLLVVLLSLLCGSVLCKECTNIPTQLSSHTYRYELLSSNNETWKEEVFSLYHLIPTDDSAWSNLLPRKMLKEEDEVDWTMTYRKIKKSSGAEGHGGFLSGLSLHDVRLDPESKHGQAQQTNLEYLLLLDVDRLVWSFRKTAGLDTSGKPYGGWEGPDVELRGHFVGHYLSATANIWASTHNDTVKEKMTAVVSAISACQEKIGLGYVSAFPSELFDRFEAIKPVWAPYYTIHKIMAGLLDQYTLAGNAEALRIATWMADYFYKRVQNVITKYSIEQHWLSLNEETGGMNDILYNLYSITGDPKHLLLAHLFDKPCFLGLLAMQADNIAGFHANTHIPIVIGSQMRYEVTGDPLYKEIGIFFMDIVNSSHSYATGGTSVSEFWSDPKRLASTLQTENEETCTTYNMLKVSRNLFRWTKEMAYADYYERALTNGVLSVQRRREPGKMIYMLPLGRGESKAVSYHGWGTKFDSFWCCYGTGIESFSKLGNSIYFEETGELPGIYIIQYISSSLYWRAGQISLNQKVEPVTSWDPRLQVTLTISSEVRSAGTASTVNFRIPVWSYSFGAKVTLNGESFSLPPPGEFLPVTRRWIHGDEITLELPISLRTEAIKDDRSEYAPLKAILYGPYLLTGLTSHDWDIEADSDDKFSDWIDAIPATYNSHLISLSQDFDDTSFALTNSNESITMEKLPEPGTNAANHATFRVILQDSTSKQLSVPEDIFGKSVMLEPFDFPGMFLVQQGEGKGLAIADTSDDAVFHIVPGLDEKKGTISLGSQIHEGCYVYSGVDHKAGATIKLACESESNAEFEQATSFVLNSGISEYHPISFVAKGTKRNFILAPLFTMTDENYTVYFNFQS